MRLNFLNNIFNSLHIPGEQKRVRLIGWKSLIYTETYFLNSSARRQQQQTANIPTLLTTVH